jgi:predicted CDP-diglyceride synthetase/phosphatidate cytidylyltransferase
MEGGGSGNTKTSAVPRIAQAGKSSVSKYCDFLLAFSIILTIILQVAQGISNHRFGQQVPYEEPDKTYLGLMKGMKGENIRVESSCLGCIRPIPHCQIKR